MTEDANENNTGNYRINDNKTMTSRSFVHKAKIIVGTPINNNTLNTELVVPLKYLSNFWRSLDLPLVVCEIEFDLPWLTECIISQILRTTAMAANPQTPTTGPIFHLNWPKLSVTVVKTITLKFRKLEARIQKNNILE